MQTVWNFDYTGAEQSVTLLPGKYKLECWGARGGKEGLDFGGGAKGGYSVGELTLKKQTVLFVYVGECGKSNPTPEPGFNGGGLGKKVSGGGATDIRLIGGEWDNMQGLLSRIIVAGGGGSCILNIDKGGTGGGRHGSNGDGYNSCFSPGGRESDGSSGLNFYNDSYFGKGGTYTAGYMHSCEYGGGGGWYGGAGSPVVCGGGGSGYILTKNSYKPKNYTPTSEYYLEHADSINGANVLNAENTNGYAKITLLQALPFLNISSYNSTTATFKADHTDLTLLTKIEYFIDDTLKETITTDLTLEKTINYTLEDNALHTLKIVVTDSNNATVEKVLTISKGIAPLPAGSSSEEVTNKWMEIKDAFKTGKTSIINTLALKNVSVSLDNTLVEFSEKIKTFFDSSDASLSQLQNQLTSANNTITQLNARYKIASGRTDPVYTGGVEKVLVYNATYEKQFYNWITINNLGFKPNVFYAECDYVNSFTKSKNKLFIFACCGLSTSSNKDFVFTCDIGLRSSDSEYKTTDCGLYYNNERDVHITDNLIHIPAFNTVNATVKASYYWRAIKIY
ncbi:glycine rich domain-containing protein [Clostridioides difficile]|nr:glycine rich domain-containing protein [Clostridioides difficile]